jgi:hypothetical protein
MFDSSTSGLSSSHLLEQLSTKWQKTKTSYARRWQYLLDISLPHWKFRWLAAGLLLFLYILRVYLLEGFHMVSYALAIYLLNRLLDFISPLEDPDTGAGGDLPVTNQADNEYKPFIRKIPEFRFWYDCCKACLLALACTFVPLFNIPVFWPILLIYFIALFVVSMKNRIQHMIKYRYIPLVNLGKPKFSRSSSTKSNTI